MKRAGVPNLKQAAVEVRHTATQVNQEWFGAMRRTGASGEPPSSERHRRDREEKVMARAVEVLEHEDAARTWLLRDNRSLGGSSPLAFLDTESGYELVLATLRRIEYGVVS